MEFSRSNFPIKSNFSTIGSNCLSATRLKLYVIFLREKVGHFVVRLRAFYLQHFSRCILSHTFEQLDLNSVQLGQASKVTS